MLSRTKRKKSIKNLKKFKKAKFNYAKFVKKYYIEDIPFKKSGIIADK